MNRLSFLRRRLVGYARFVVVAVSTLAVLGLSGCQSMLAMATAYDNKNINKQLPAFEKYAKDAEPLIIDQPLPAWRVQLPSLEVDDVVAIPQGFLVGTTDFGSVYGRPIYGPYMALDPQGKILWTISRRPNRENLYSVESVAPVLIYSRINGAMREYFAADMTSGKPIWTNEFPLNALVAVRSDAGALLVAQLEKESLRFSAVDMKSGQVRWKVDVPGKFDQLDPPTTVQIPGGVLILARDLGAITWAGQYKALSSQVGPVSRESYVLLRPDAIVVPDRAGYLVNVGFEGQAAWRYKLNGAAASLTSDGGWTFVETKLGAASGEITAIAADGRKQWVFPVNTALKSPLVAAENRIAFTIVEGGKRKLVLLNKSTGQTVGRIDIPGRDNKTLPDLFEVYPGRLVVLQEEGISSIRLDQPRLEWSFDFSNYVAFRYDKMQPKEQRVDSIPASSSKTTSASTADGAVSSSTSIRPPRSESIRLDMARASEAATYSRTSSVLSSASSTRPQRSAARQERMAATAATIGALNAEAASARREAWANAAGAVGTALGPVFAPYVAAYISSALSEVAREDEKVRDSFRLDMSVVNYQRMFQRDWYLRPVSADKRNSVVLVDVKNGRWQEIIVEPSSVVHRYALGTQIPTVSNDLLFVRGAGLDPKQWRTHETNSFHAVGADAMAFRLGDIRFIPSEQFPTAFRNPGKPPAPKEATGSATK